jgi:long-chain acyl-CoA synthetase
LKALVVRSGEVTAEDLIAYCRENLAHPKCPRTIDFVDDLGRTPMGKLNKKALQAPYWADPPADAGRPV